MKILLVLGAFSYGGAERVMCSLANYFAENGNQVTITAVSKADETYYLDETVKRINGLNWKSQFDGVKKLRKVIKEENPDVIVSFLTHINIATILASRFTGIPVIISERNNPAVSATSSLRKILRLLTYRWADQIVFQTEDAKNYFSGKIKKKGTVIQNPLYLNEKYVPFDQRENKIVSVARLVPQKRHDLTIRAFARISDICDYELYIYGDGDDIAKNELREFAIKLQIQDRVHIMGAVSDLHHQIKSAKVFVMMSEYEGMPNALMEAMGLGLVCISTDCPSGGPKYLIENGCNGYLVEVNDLEALVNIMKNTLKDTDAMKSVSNEAQKIREKLDAKDVFFMWSSLVKKTMNDR